MPHERPRHCQGKAGLVLDPGSWGTAGLPCPPGPTRLPRGVGEPPAGGLRWKRKGSTPGPEPHSASSKVISRKSSRNHRAQVQIMSCQDAVPKGSRKTMKRKPQLRGGQLGGSS